jgi:hypothetical protein
MDLVPIRVLVEPIRDGNDRINGDVKGMRRGLVECAGPLRDDGLLKAA